MRWSRMQIRTHKTLGKRCCACAISLLGVTLAVTPAFAAQREGKKVERQEIRRLEQRWKEAQLADDIASMDKLLSDQYLGVTATGQVVTKAQQLDRIRSHRLDLRQVSLSDTKIKISGNLAVVTSLAEVDGVVDGNPEKGSFRYTRVYQRVPGDGWKITNFEVTHVGRQHASVSPGPFPEAKFVAPPLTSPR